MQGTTYQEEGMTQERELLSTRKKARLTVRGEGTMCTEGTTSYRITGGRNDLHREQAEVAEKESTNRNKGPGSCLKKRTTSKEGRDERSMRKSRSTRKIRRLTMTAVVQPLRRCRTSTV